MVDKPGMPVPVDADCRLAEESPELKYVSRGRVEVGKGARYLSVGPVRSGGAQRWGLNRWIYAMLARTRSKARVRG